MLSGYFILLFYPIAHLSNHCCLPALSLVAGGHAIFPSESVFLLSVMLFAWLQSCQSTQATTAELQTSSAQPDLPLGGLERASGCRAQPLCEQLPPVKHKPGSLGEGAGCSAGLGACLAGEAPGSCAGLVTWGVSVLFANSPSAWLFPLSRYLWGSCPITAAYYQAHLPRVVYGNTPACVVIDWAAVWNTATSLKQGWDPFRSKRQKLGLQSPKSLPWYTASGDEAEPPSPRVGISGRHIHTSWCHYQPACTSASLIYIGREWLHWKVIAGMLSHMFLLSIFEIEL